MKSPRISALLRQPKLPWCNASFLTQLTARLKRFVDEQTDMSYLYKSKVAILVDGKLAGNKPVPHALGAHIMIKKVLLAASAASLAIAPVAAQAQAQRSSAPAEEKSELGLSTPLLLVALAAVAVGAFLIIDDGDDDAISD